MAIVSTHPSDSDRVHGASGHSFIKCNLMTCAATTYLGANLVAALTGLQVHDFTHDADLRYGARKTDVK